MGNNSLSENMGKTATCEAFFASIDALLHDELSQTESLNVRNHFTACNRCRRVLIAELRFRSLILHASNESLVLPGSLSELGEFQSIVSSIPPDDAASSKPQKRGMPPLGRMLSMRLPKLVSFLKKVIFTRRFPRTAMKIV